MSSSWLYQPGLHGLYPLLQHAGHTDGIIIWKLINQGISFISSTERRRTSLEFQNRTLLWSATNEACLTKCGKNGRDFLPASLCFILPRSILLHPSLPPSSLPSSAFALPHSHFPFSPFPLPLPLPSLLLPFSSHPLYLLLNSPSCPQTPNPAPLPLPSHSSSLPPSLLLSPSLSLKFIKYHNGNNIAVIST